MDDPSRGYDRIADEFIAARRRRRVGETLVREWAATLAPGSDVLDVGCGNGAPVSELLADAGAVLHAIDASARMVAAYRDKFPDASVKCEALEVSTFFDRKFDAIIACGVIFLVEPEIQQKLILRMAHALKPRGQLVFTAPASQAVWTDVLTGMKSWSLGGAVYRQLIRAAGLEVTREADDEGDNHYYFAVRPSGKATEQLHHRLARRADIDSLRLLMNAAISELQKPFLDAREIESSRTIMGLDTQLIDDGTYFIVEADSEIAGCGGWSRRATLYGGDQTPDRSPELLDPRRDAARVRAMYTHPKHVRKGIGRLILSLCEEAARSEGFERVELMSTLAGEPLYTACGYVPVERISDSRGGAAVPLIRMTKTI